MDNDTSEVPAKVDRDAPNVGSARGPQVALAGRDARQTTPTNKPAASMLPVAEPFHAISTAGAKERGGVFGHLVTDDGDIAGLVAYSIYKQNKLDWLGAFEAAKGRPPTEDELASYIIGEGTPRRIATYRHLAEATLAGNGPGVSRPGNGPRVGLRHGSILGDRPAVVATYAVIALIFLIGFLLAAHYTMSSR